MNDYLILIVEDDISIGNMIQEALGLEGYRITRAYSGPEALMILERTKPDMVLLDLMLPGLSGNELITKLGGIPTMVMSAKSDLDSKIELLKKGACDYITKPFAISELLARIEAHLRLASAGNKGDTIEEDDVIKAGSVKLDTGLLKVTIGEKGTNLTRTEVAILGILMRNAGRPLGRNTILDRISEDTPDCTERSLKQHVSNVRKKLQQLDGVDHIEAIYGIGFQFN